jgi:hypothetical protein
LIEERSVPEPNMAIYVEPTMLDVCAAKMGFIVCDIALVAKSAYFSIRSGRAGPTPERFCSRPFCREYFTRVASIYLEAGGS